MKNYDLISVLDTEGDIVLGINKKGNDTITVTISTPNNEKNSQLLDNLGRCIENDTKEMVDGQSFCFDVQLEDDLYVIQVAGKPIMYLTEDLQPSKLTKNQMKEGTNELVLNEKIHPVVKQRLAQKTDFSPTISDETLFSNLDEQEREEIVDSMVRADLHNHLAGLLPPNRLIALGIRHNVDYNISLIQKYDIDISERPDLMADLIKQVSQIKNKSGEVIGEKFLSTEVQELITGSLDTIPEEKIKSEYARVLELIKDGTIPGKPLEDIAIPFNDVITIPGNLEKISLSMRLQREGQAVFTNLEEVYDARDPFTKNNGRVVDRSESDTKKSPLVPTEEEIKSVLSTVSTFGSYEATQVSEMLEEMQSEQGKIEGERPDVAARFRNGLQEDMHLWIGEEAKTGGVEYIETSQAALAKAGKNTPFLESVNGEPNVLDYIEARTGTTIKYLAAIRRNFDSQKDFDKAAQTVIESAQYGSCVGVDFMGEELNETAHFSKTITDIARYAIEKDPNFVIRVHAGENNTNIKNIEQVIDAVDRAFEERFAELHPNEELPRDEETGDIDFSKVKELGGDSIYPQIRIGHGLYGPIDDKELMDRMARRGVVVEFNMSSNVRLNNMAPEKAIKTFHNLIETYVKAGDKEKGEGKGIGIAFATDGYGIYGTTMKTEVQYALQALSLSQEAIERIALTIDKSISQNKDRVDRETEHTIESKEGVTREVEVSQEDKEEVKGKKEAAESIIDNKKAIVIAGGSFGTDVHSAETRESAEVTEEEKAVINEIIEKSDPEKVAFVIGHTGAAQEGYLLQRLEELAKQGNEKAFDVIAVMPTLIKSNDEGKFLAQTEGEIDDIESAFRVARNPMIKGILTDGASREGTSIYKTFAKRVFSKEGSTLIAFDGDAPLSNLIQEARNKGTTIYGRSGKEVIDEKLESLGTGESANKTKGKLITFDPVVDVIEGSKATTESVKEMIEHVANIAKGMDEKVVENDDNIR